MLASLRNHHVLALFYVSLNSIYCIVVSSLLFSPSIYKSCFVICLQLPLPRLVHELFAGGKVMQLVIFQFSIKFVVVWYMLEGYIVCNFTIWQSSMAVAQMSRDLLPHISESNLWAQTESV